MSLPNFSSLACLEVAKKFVVVVGWVVVHLATISNSNEVAIEFLWVELSYVGVLTIQMNLSAQYWGHDRHSMRENWMSPGGPLPPGWSPPACGPGRTACTGWPARTPADVVLWWRPTWPGQEPRHSLVPEQVPTLTICTYQGLDITVIITTVPACWYSVSSSRSLMMNLHSNSLFLAARGRTKLSFSSHAGLDASPRTLPLRWDGWWWWWWWWWEREFCFSRGQRWCELLIIWWRRISGYSTGSSHQLSPCSQGWTEAERRTLWQNNLLSLA